MAGLLDFLSPTTGGGLLGNPLALIGASVLAHNGPTTYGHAPNTFGTALGSGLLGGLDTYGKMNYLAQETQAKQLQNQLTGMTLKGYQDLQNLRPGPNTAPASFSASMPGGTTTVPTPPQIRTQLTDAFDPGVSGPARAQEYSRTSAASDGGVTVPTAPATPAASAGTSQPLFNVPSLKAQYDIAARTPGLQNLAQQLLTELNKGVPEGAYMDQSGNIAARPGYYGYLYNKSAADAAGAAPYKALESLLSRAGTPVRLEPGDSVTTGFQTLPPQVQQLFSGLTLPGAAPRAPVGMPGAVPAAAPTGAPASPSRVAGGTGVDATGFPIQSIHGPQGTLQAPLTLAGKALQTTVLPEQFKKAGENYTAAQAVSGQLDMMDHAIETLNASGWSSTGPGADTKFAAMKGLNALAQTFGMNAPFDPAKIATWEDFNKEATRMGFELAKTLGSREAQMIVQQAVAAVPNASNTYMGARLVSSSLRQASQRQSDYYEFLNDYAMKHGGNTMGADIAFNKAHPPSEYTKTAIVNAIPEGAKAMLLQNPDLKGQFDLKYGMGSAKAVLGQ